MQLHHNPPRLNLEKPIRVVSERRTSPTSTRGSIASGGGLDAAAVSRLVGVENINKPFTENGDLLPVLTQLAGDWRVATDHLREGTSDASFSVQDDAITTKTQEYFQKNSFLLLPPGIVLRYSHNHENSFHVEVSHTLPCHKRLFSRIIFAPENNAIPQVQYWLEEKITTA